MKRDGTVILAHDLETVAMAASRLNVSNSWVYTLIKQGKLDYYEIGNRKLVHVRDINALLAERSA